MNAIGRSFFVLTTVVSIALACTGCGASAGNLAVAKAPTSQPTTADHADLGPVCDARPHAHRRTQFGSGGS